MLKYLTLFALAVSADGDEDGHSHGPTGATEDSVKATIT